MRYIKAEDVNDLSLENGFSSSVESMTGVVEWRNPETEFVVLATPNWETDGDVSIDTCTDDGEYSRVMVLKLQDVLSISDQLDLYLKTIEFVTNYHLNN